MASEEWVRGPFGPDASKGETVTGVRTVLAVVHHLTAATRLADVLPLLEEDRRVQVIFTVPPGAIFRGSGVEAARAADGLVIPWEQARQLRFDLAIAAEDGALGELHAPVLTMPHGTSGNRYVQLWSGFGRRVPRAVVGTERERFISHGRVVPSAVIVPSERRRRLLGSVCPEVLPAVVVGGDPCFDRMLASLPLRERYRQAFGVAPGRRLVVVSSTWSPASAVGRDRELIPRLVEELGNDHRVVAVLHPNIWSWHGRRQVRSWYADCARRGLILLPPEEGWRAALIAADGVVGDHGSTTTYAAALGRPVLLASFPDDEVAPGTEGARLAEVAPRLDPASGLGEQVETLIAGYEPERFAGLRAMVTSVPGAAASIIRHTMYRLMRLDEPEVPATTSPVPLPVGVGT